MATTPPGGLDDINRAQRDAGVPRKNRSFMRTGAGAGRGSRTRNAINAALAMGGIPMALPRRRDVSRPNPSIVRGGGND